MKRTTKTVKAVAFTIVLAMLMATLAFTLSGCSSSKVVMSFAADNGKTYTATLGFYKFMMTYSKQQFYTQYGLNSSVESTIWDTKSDDDKTYDELYTERVKTQVKSILIEQYLFDKYNLSISDETIASHKKTVETAKKNQGGAGAFKQYYGYTADQLYDYFIMIEKSKAIVDYLYGENGIDPVTSEELDSYYKENYVGYMYIMLDMNNKVKTDDEGNRVVKTTTDSDGKVTEQEAFETEELTEEEAEEKGLLAAKIIKELEGGADFAELVQKYSDDFYSIKYPKGVFVLKDSDLVSGATTINEAVKKLEVGERTDALSTGDTNDYTYIVKRIDLLDKVYENEDYEDLFSDYADDVKYDKYDGVVETYDTSVTTDSDAISGLSMKETFLSAYVDYYYYYSRYGYSIS